MTLLLFCDSVALRDIDLAFVWQAWYLRHWAGSGGTLGGVVFCVARVVFGGFAAAFLWQVRRFVTSTLLSCDRRGA